MAAPSTLDDTAGGNQTSGRVQNHAEGVDQGISESSISWTIT